MFVSLGLMLFDFFIACLSRRKHNKGTDKWPVDWHKLTDVCPIVPSLDPALVHPIYVSLYT